MAALAALAMTACEYKDLESYGTDNEMADIFLSFNWAKVDSIPSKMRVAFYPQKYPRGYTFFDVLNKDSVVQLPAGIYEVIAWNKDIMYARTNGYSSHHTVYATTGNASPHGNYMIPVVLDSIFPGQKVLDYPDYMVHDCIVGREIILGQENRVELKPDSMVVTVDVKLHGIAGLEYCNNIRGCINNLAGKRYIAYDNLTEDTVTVMYDCAFSPKDSTVTAHFWIFGIAPTDSNVKQHKMVVFFWTKYGKVYVPIDITKACSVYTRDDRYILLESPELGLDLKDYIPIGAGGDAFDVELEDWVNTDIPMTF